MRPKKNIRKQELECYYLNALFARATRMRLERNFFFRNFHLYHAYYIGNMPRYYASRVHVYESAAAAWATTYTTYV